MDALLDKNKTIRNVNGHSDHDGLGKSINIDSFLRRHTGTEGNGIEEMLRVVGFNSLDELVDLAIPESIRLHKKINLPLPVSEYEALAELKSIAIQNEIFRSYIGMGYHDCVTPPVILRNILENPGWYTAYTPYQAEISQGRLEALLNFQTMIIDMTGMEIANASLLDEATAAAEAMNMFWNLKEDSSGNSFFVSSSCHPQTIDVIRTRAIPVGINIVVGDHREIVFSKDYFGSLVQYPSTEGGIFDYSEFSVNAKAHNVKIVAACDILSLALLAPPGEWGADAAIGSSQRFGVPLGFGGPHAGFFATKDEFKRLMPGRLIGVSHDANGKLALRLSLQTREQHIRREKATSNICTAQVLLAVISSLYAVYHGREGIRQIASKVNWNANTLAKGLRKLGYAPFFENFFDTLYIPLQPAKIESIQKIAGQFKINFRMLPGGIVIALDETVSRDDISDILTIFNDGKKSPFPDEVSGENVLMSIQPKLRRQSDFLTHPVFNTYHSETKFLRYVKKLESRDLSLTTSMIPLGSCTMKLNAAVEMLPVTWPEFGKIHPFAPEEQTHGYHTLFRQLELWLSEITGFAAVSLQPNAGSQGEYAGLLAIRDFHNSRNESHRNVCLIPVSAHGTNPASAAMAGFNVVVVACDQDGNVDLNDLKEKAEDNKSELAALMITYPSTHGVFEESVRTICDIVHQNGGQVYMDGANMNAQVGLCRPGDIGADVCHLNLHKTFCIPHGGGGPGMGPIGVAKHLVPFLPGHSVVRIGRDRKNGAVSAAPWGSASILPISWVYIRLLGQDGLAFATKMAILNANYIAKRLGDYFPVLYKGRSGLVAHECIVDFRQFKKLSEIEVEDGAKRLMDYGFHAPTMSFPVPGTMMIEPTESEAKDELDRFCDAMILIYGEIKKVESGEWDKKDNPLKNAPHTAPVVIADNWMHKYSRETAAYPAPWTKEHKFWPYVGRIDNVYGDRNLICSCPPLEDYISSEEK